MNILFVTREYPPFEVGGVAVHTFNLVKNLSKLGVSCKVLSFGDPNFSNETVMFVKPSSSIISKSNCPSAMDVKIPFDIRRLTHIANDLIKKENIDVVHVEEPYVGAFVRYNRKVTTVHDTSYGEIKSMLHFPPRFMDLKRAIFYTSLGFYFEMMCIASSQLVIVPSSEVKEELLGIYQIPEAKVKVIRNGVAFPELKSTDKTEAKQRLELSAQKLLIFTACRHITRKRLDILLEAIRLLHKEGVEGYNLVIAGDGPLRPYITNLVNKYDLECVVELPGWVSKEELDLYYQAADIFVLTSEYETGPMSLLEAMSFGAAVVSSQIDEFPRLMRNDIDGLLFPVGNHHALANCLRKLLNNTLLRMRISASARLFANRFSWKDVAEDTVKLYESLF